MQDLKSQLLKAKLVNKKQVRRSEHQDRLRRKKVGREGIQEEKRLRQQEQEEKARQRRIAQQEENERRKQEAEQRSAQRSVDDLLAGARVLDPGFGSRRFHFVASDGTIPCLEMSEEMAIRLERGTAAIVEVSRDGERRFLLVTSDVAGMLLKEAPETVRLWNRE